MRNLPKQYLTKYSYKNDVEKQSSIVLSNYPGLSAALETFYFEDGSNKELICLKGTIPISFQRATYNIPISIHLPEQYPHRPPIVYVKPTSSMSVKPNKNVDANGHVRLPYVLNWNSRTHSLGGAVQAMTHDFSTTPPVYAKKPVQQQQPPPPVQQPAMPPYPNYGPPQMGANTPAPGFNPYGGYPPQPQMIPPPYPGSYSAGPGGAGANPTPNSGLPPYPVNPSYNPYNPAPGTAANPGGGGPVQQPQHNSSMYSNNGIGADPIKASLLTAITENLSRRIEGAREMAQKDLDKLRTVQTQLKSNRDSLEMTVGQLEQQVAVANSHIDVLSVKKAEIEAALQQLQTKSEQIDIDEAITPSYPLYKQLLNLYAEECAIEDTTYYLDKALMDNVVDLETYLKNVRALSRKQFMLRAQMQKARQTAGLRNVTPH